MPGIWSKEHVEAWKPIGNGVQFSFAKFGILVWYLIIVSRNGGLLEQVQIISPFKYFLMCFYVIF